MDTQIYRYFIAVAESEGISAAAKQLFLSQSALTKQIARLEREWDMQFFVRGSKNMTLTPAGEIFLDYAYRYKAMEKEMTAHLSQVRKPGKAHIRLAVNSRGGDYIGRHMPAFLASHPEVCVEYLEESAEKCEAMLLNENVDLLIYTDPVRSGGIEYMPLEEDRLVLVIPRTYMPCLSGDVGCSFDSPHPLSVEMIKEAQIPYVLSTPNRSLYEAEQAMFRRMRYQPEKTMQVDSFGIRYAVAVGGGGAMLSPIPYDQMHVPNGVAVCCIREFQMYRYVIIARKKNRVLSDMTSELWKYLVECRFKAD